MNEYHSGRFARSTREAFRRSHNPVFTPRRSRFAGEFERPSWILRVVRFLRQVLHG